MNVEPYTVEEINEMLGKSPKLLNRVMSEIDKIDNILILEDGRVKHRMMRTTKPNPHYKKQMRKYKKKKGFVSVKEEPKRYIYGKYREWPNFDKFKVWRRKLLKAR